VSSFPRVDPLAPPSAFKRALVSIALSKPGTWFYINVASRIDPFLVRLTRGRFDSGFGVVGIMLMTTVGAKTGVERTVPLLYFSDGGDAIVMASSFGRPKHPAWYHNAKAAGQVTLYRKGQTARFTVEETQGAERDRLYKLADGMYRGYSVYEGRAKAQRQIPVLRLTPVADR
jgi:deazaflavin-dependent oxidoreductase (nitroreductase family)